LSDGLRAYSYDGTSFTNTAHINVDKYAVGVDVGPDGTVFLLNVTTGIASQYWYLGAYPYDGTSFTNTARSNSESDDVGDVAVGPDGTVFWAQGFMGLSAYVYSGYTGIERNYSSVPQGVTLVQNYPNPFNPRTNIEFSIPKTEFVTIKIYNLLGQEVTTLVSEKLTPGNYIYNWDAEYLSSGIYLCQLQVGNYFKTRKMILIK
jgi:hypothetical protein